MMGVISVRKWPCKILLAACLSISTVSAQEQERGSKEQSAVTANGSGNTPQILYSSDHSNELAVTNPQRLELPEERVRILHRLVKQVVKNYLRIRENEPEAPLVLVMGEEKEHFTLGSPEVGDAIYLKKWDESKFVASDVSLTVQHLVIAFGLTQMTQEISTRINQIATVDKRELRYSINLAPSQSRGLSLNSCVAGITDASQEGSRCDHGTQATFENR